MRRALILAIRAYQLTLASILGGQCRFEPSCSHYAREAIECHGAIRGIRLATGRILRCHPFARAGYDPVPAGHNAQHRPITAHSRRPRKTVAEERRSET